MVLPLPGALAGRRITASSLLSNVPRTHAPAGRLPLEEASRGIAGLASLLRRALRRRAWSCGHSAM